MSYILDALKKSDRERQRDRQGTLSVPQAEYRVRRHEAPAGAWTLMVLALVLVAAVAGALFAYSWRTGESVLAESPGSQPLPPEQQTSSPAPATPVAEAAPAAAALPAPLASEPEAAPELREIWQLTAAEQRYLQDLAVSLHVYSIEPAQRTVIVNGLRVREGQPLGQDLRLLEITPDGLILEFQHQRVHLATVQGS